MIKNKNIETNFELVFKLIYFAFTLMSFNAFCARQFYISYISYAVVFFGAIVIINRLTHLKDYLNVNIYLMMAFVVSYGISSLTVLRYGIMENFQGMIWMAIQYFAVFAFDKHKDKGFVNKEFEVILYFFLAYTFVMAVAGLVMMFVGFGFFKIVEVKYIIAGGFIWNRLYGGYMDPNYGAVFCISSILTSLYSLSKTKTKWFKAFLVLNVIVEYWHIACSDSRTGLVAIFAAFLIYISLLLIKKGKKAFIAVSLAIVVSVALAGGAVALQKGTSFVNAKITMNRLVNAGYSEEEIAYMLDLERIGRLDEEINNGDVSNNRFAIWKSGFDIFAEHPVTGISFRNIIEFADGEEQDSFISKSGFESMHNSFVDILVSQGVIGMAIIIALMVSVFTSLIKKHKYIQDEDYGRFLLAFSCIAGIFAEMMFYSETFYMNTGSAFMFWYFLGYIFNYLIPNSKGETT